MMRSHKIAAIFLIIVLTVSFSMIAEIGFGVKLVSSNVPFIIANIKSKNFGLEGGAGYSSSSLGGLVNFSIVWYLVNAKLYFPLGAVPISPYVGAGIEGLIISVSSPFLNGQESMGTIGLDLLGGLEFSAVPYGIPLVVFGGIDYVWMSLEALEFPFSVIGFAWHVGIRIEI